MIVRVPAGTAKITLVVEDANGSTALRYCPVWACHETLAPPLAYGDTTSGFRITRDVTPLESGGRELQVELFGQDGAFDEDVIPAHALMCYWEDATFGGDAPPAVYRDQMLGWVLRDAVMTQLYRGYYQLTLVTAHAILDTLDGIADTLQRDDAPQGWTQMAHITDDRLIAYLLRWHSTALDVCNLYPSGISDEWGTSNIADASLWQQVKALVKDFSGEACFDSLNGLSVQRHPAHEDETTRAARGVLMTLTASDLTDADGVLLDYQRRPRTGLVIAVGQAWIGGKSVVYQSHAPGKTPGASPGVETLPMQVLPADGSAQTVLDRLAGSHYARDNGPLLGQGLSLLGNLDVVEPGWLQPLALDLVGRNPRGLAFSDARIIVTGVTVTHSAERGQPAKRISWTVDFLTEGIPGEPVPVVEDSSPPGDDDPYPGTGLPDDETALELLPDGEVFALLTSGGYLLTCDDWSSGPTWALGLDLVTAGLHGDLLGFQPDPFSPGYAPGGGAVNTKLVTTLRVEDLDDVFGTPALTSRHTFAVEAARRIIHTERGVPNFYGVATYYPGSGTYLAVTTDGTTWSEGVVSSVVRSSGSGPDLSAFDWAHDIDLVNTDPATYGITLRGTWVAGVGVVADSGVIGIKTAWRLSVTIPATGTWGGVVEHSDFGFIGIYGHVSTDPLNGGPTSTSLVFNNPGAPDTDFGFTMSNWIASGGSWEWSGAPTQNVTMEEEGVLSLVTNHTAVHLTDPTIVTRVIVAGNTIDPWPTLPDYVTGDTAPMPTLYVSPRVAGRLRLGAYVNDGGEIVGKLFQSDDYGATTSQVDIPATDFGDGIGGNFNEPYDGDGMLSIWNKATLAGNIPHMTQLGGHDYTEMINSDGGPVGPRAVDTNPNNRSHVAMVRVRFDGYTRLEVSRSGGMPGTWTPLTDWAAPGTGFTWVAVSGSDTLYAGGWDCLITGPALGSVLYDKVTNIPDDFPSAGEILGIIGGPVSG